MILCFILYQFKAPKETYVTASLSFSVVLVPAVFQRQTILV